MDNKDSVQSRSDKLQRKHNQVKEKQSISAHSPAPYVVYFFQDKTTSTKRKRKKTIKIETASSIKKIVVFSFIFLSFKVTL